MQTPGLGRELYWSGVVGGWGRGRRSGAGRTARQRVRAQLEMVELNVRIQNDHVRGPRGSAPPGDRRRQQLRSAHAPGLACRGRGRRRPASTAIGWRWLASDFGRIWLTSGDVGWRGGPSANGGVAAANRARSGGAEAPVCSRQGAFATERESGAVRRGAAWRGAACCVVQSGAAWRGAPW